jgi:hypothetical protein
LLDEMEIHLLPVFLGEGVRLFEDPTRSAITLEQARDRGARGNAPHVPDRHSRDRPSVRAYLTRSCGGSPVDFDAVADELYGLSLGEFTAVRDARAAEASRAGDRGLARAIKMLRRPTKGAWSANVLVRQRREQVDELFRLGEAMQDAQDQLAGEELGQFSRRRHEVVSALAREARRIASDAGDPISDEVARELEATLEAARADLRTYVTGSRVLRIRPAPADT